MTTMARVGEKKGYYRSKSKRRGIISIRKLDKETFEKLLIILFCICVFLIVLIPALAIPLKYIAIPLILVGLLRYESFNYLLFPFSFLDNVIGTYLAGRVTLFWIYLFVLFIKLFGLERRSFLSRDRIVLMLGLILFFAGVALPVYGVNSIKMMMVIFCGYALSLDWFKNPEKLKAFLFVVITSTMVTVVSLLFSLTGTIAAAGRTTGIGFNDPNYSSFLCCMGLCAILNYTVMRYKWITICASLIFIFGIVRSGSRTGLLAIAAILIMQILFTRGMVKKVKLILLTVIAAGAFSLFILPMFSEIFSPLLDRVEYTMNMLSQGNYARATADRTIIAEIYISYYKKQNIIMQLFGGNVLASTQLFTAIGQHKVTHNVYIDYLMAFGAVGGAIMMGSYIIRMIRYLIKHIDTRIVEFRGVFLMKLCGLIFGIGIALLQVSTWWILCLI